ncbi:class I SAM-dependent methyltransferase [Acidobacteria bacterium AH-259-D05]|nr:class I SAM-dependent methyltransferase [Acidobacteria bacterium AH-259-D05]
MKMECCGYDVLAREYYDPFHKTCRNFDFTTVDSFAKHPVPIPEDGLVLEVGCGRGRCAEFLSIEARWIVQLDSSREMLALEDREPCLLQVYADAASVPLFDKQFTALVGFLIDAFIGLNFFSEAYRLLEPGGLFFATTPTAEWGHTLRDDLGIDGSVARFLTKGQETVIVPSTLIPVDQLNEMLAHTGFQNISITSHCLPWNADHPISPDIQQVADKKEIAVHELPIVHFITATKL